MQPSLRTAALLAGFTSLASFLALAWLTGGYNQEVGGVVAADAVAMALVVVACCLQASRHTPGRMIVEVIVSQTPTVQCKPSGPYLVKGLSDLQTSSGASLPTQPVMALCRCGGSANKPYCDGTHQRNGFTGANPTAAPAERADYRAPGITIHDNRAQCAHAGHCTDGLASVFKYGSEPWIDPAGASVAAIVETIGQCPSGALTYTLDVPEPTQPVASPSIVATKNGPYAVGGVVLDDPASGQAGLGERYTLCRCGGSKNKPFCDGSHWSNGFADEKS